MTPPASTEPMHCDHEKYCKGFCTAGTWSNYCNGLWCKEEYDTRARGPVAQQAPTTCQICLKEMALFCQDCPHIISSIKGELKGKVAEHDAALIAQEREKWERERAQDTLEELDTTIWMLYEFCEWFCGRDCEETPCMITVSRLHERLPGIQKQMKEHPEYLEKWNVKRAEQKSLRSEVGKK